MPALVNPCYSLGQMKDEDSNSYSWLSAAVDEAGTGFWEARQGIGAACLSPPSLDMQVQCPAVRQTAAATGM